MHAANQKRRDEAPSGNQQITSVGQYGVGISDERPFGRNPSGSFGRDASSYQQQAAQIMRDLPYGSPGDRAKRRSMMQQADGFIKLAGQQQRGSIADQRTALDASQFNQGIGFKQRGQDFTEQQAGITQSNADRQFGLDAYEAMNPNRAITQPWVEQFREEVVEDPVTGLTKTVKVPTGSGYNKATNRFAPIGNPGVQLGAGIGDAKQAVDPASFQSKEEVGEAVRNGLDEDVAKAILKNRFGM